MKIKDDIIVAMTGASGAVYGLRFIQRASACGVTMHVLISEAARVVLKQEQDVHLPERADEAAKSLSEHLNIKQEQLRCYELKDWFSPAASGSAGIRRMVVIPCSMGTLAGIASGAADNLIERAADVMIKESGRLLLVPRESPLSSIHLENMLGLAQKGVHIIPAMPGFYHRPRQIEDLVDFVVDRVLDHLGLDDREARRWGD